MPPSQPPAFLYATRDDLVEWMSQAGLTGRVDDDGAGVISPDDEVFITKALYRATSRVNFYLLKRYSASDLATDWLVNEWTCCVASHTLACRRGNPSPSSTIDLFKAAISDMERVHKGEFDLDLGCRFSNFPAWSNVRVELVNRLRKVVTERPISERGGPGPGPGNNPASMPDWAADYLLDWGK